MWVVCRYWCGVKGGFKRGTRETREEDLYKKRIGRRMSGAYRYNSLAQKNQGEFFMGLVLY
jgi:hypothetical protein